MTSKLWKFYSNFRIQTYFFDSVGTISFSIKIFRSNRDELNLNISMWTRACFSELLAFFSEKIGKHKARRLRSPFQKWESGSSRLTSHPELEEIKKSLDSSSSVGQWQAGAGDGRQWQAVAGGAGGDATTSRSPWQLNSSLLYKFVL